MIMEAKAAHKVPAISTSEDSQEIQQPSPSLSTTCRGTPTTNKKDNDAAQQQQDDDESRDISETRRVVHHKPTMNRDGMELAFDKEEGTSSGSVVAGLSEMAVEHDMSNLHQKDTGGNVGKGGAEMKPATSMTSTESVVKENRNPVDTNHHSLLPSPSASFDHAMMDGQPWSHSFNHTNAGVAAVSREKQMPKPKHRRSPATTVRSFYSSF
jgi:hypothetical protein